MHIVYQELFGKYFIFSICRHINLCGYIYIIIILVKFYTTCTCTCVPVMISTYPHVHVHVHACTLSVHVYGVVCMQRLLGEVKVAYHFWIVEYVLSDYVPRLEHGFIGEKVKYAVKVSTGRIKPVCMVQVE